jgi:hypothetical protein
VSGKLKRRNVTLYQAAMTGEYCGTRLLAAANPSHDSFATNCHSVWQLPNSVT